MDLNINYFIEDHNKVKIEDNTNLFKLYTDEYAYYNMQNQPKYSDTESVLVIVKKDASGDVSKDQIVETIYYDHTDHVGPKSDIFNLKLKEDGYYQIHFLVMPTTDWLYWHQTKGIDVSKKYDDIFFLGDDHQIYKLHESNPIDLKLFITLNLDALNTPVSNKTINFFVKANVECCYYNYAKQLFDALLKKCITHEYDDIIYKRDFILMTIKILDYLVSFEQFLEAQRVLDILNGCGGFCHSVDHVKSGRGCGCTKS